MQIEQEVIRIPRPLGTTNLAITGLNEALEDRIIESYLRGSFPFEGVGIDLYSFSSLYGVPLKKLKARIHSQIGVGLQDGEKDLYKALEKERLRMLDGVIGRIGDSDFETLRILRKLTSLVLPSRDPNPLLVKEINSAIGNQIRLSETQLKAIAQISEALSHSISTEPEERTLTRTEILERIEGIKANPKELEPYLEDVPMLDPIPEETRLIKKSNYNREATHDYQKLEDLERIPTIDDIPISPM